MCFFFKQKTAYELRISDWSSDVCSSDLIAATTLAKAQSVASAFPGVTAVEAAGSTATADVVIVATPYDKAVAALAAAGSLDRKVIIDISNPLTADYSGLTLGHSP